MCWAGCLWVRAMSMGHLRALWALLTAMGVAKMTSDGGHRSARMIGFDTGIRTMWLVLHIRCKESGASCLRISRARTTLLLSATASASIYAYRADSPQPANSSHTFLLPCLVGPCAIMVTNLSFGDDIANVSNTDAILIRYWFRF